MSSKLSGYGHTAGESMGGTGANMNQQHGGSSGGVCTGEVVLVMATVGDSIVIKEVLGKEPVPRCDHQQLRISLLNTTVSVEHR